MITLVYFFSLTLFLFISACHHFSTCFSLYVSLRYLQLMSSQKYLLSAGCDQQITEVLCLGVECTTLTGSLPTKLFHHLLTLFLKALGIQSYLQRRPAGACLCSHRPQCNCTSFLFPVMNVLKNLCWTKCLVEEREPAMQRAHFSTGTSAATYLASTGDGFLVVGPSHIELG